MFLLFTSKAVPFKQKLFGILQGLGVGPGSATEHWPKKAVDVEKERKKKKERDTPRSRGGPGGCDRMLAVKSRKKRPKKKLFFCKKKKLAQKNFYPQYIF